MKVTLQGTKEVALIKAITNRALTKLCKKGAHSVMGHLLAITAEPTPEQPSLIIQQLMHSYQDMFN